MSDDHLEDSNQEERIRRILAARCRIAGGARVGFSIRRAALEAQASGDHSELRAATRTVLDQIVDSDRLRANEGGDRVYVTESGLSWLAGDAGSAPKAD